MYPCWMIHFEWLHADSLLQESWEIKPLLELLPVCLSQVPMAALSCARCGWFDCSHDFSALHHPFHCHCTSVALLPLPLLSAWYSFSTPFNSLSCYFVSYFVTYCLIVVCPIFFRVIGYLSLGSSSLVSMTFYQRSPRTQLSVTASSRLQ